MNNNYHETNFNKEFPTDDIFKLSNPTRLLKLLLLFKSFRRVSNIKKSIKYTIKTVFN